MPGSGSSRNGKLQIIVKLKVSLLKPSSRRKRGRSKRKERSPCLSWLVPLQSWAIHSSALKVSAILWTAHIFHQHRHKHIYIFIFICLFPRDKVCGQRARRAWKIRNPIDHFFHPFFPSAHWPLDSARSFLSTWRSDHKSPEITNSLSDDSMVLFQTPKNAIEASQIKWKILFIYCK